MAIATAVIAIGLVFTAIQLRDTRRNRRVELARSLVDDWQNPELVKARSLMGGLAAKDDDGVETLVNNIQAGERRIREGEANEGDEYYVYLRHLNFFEELGLLFKKDRAGQKAVYQVLGDVVADAWTTWGPTIRKVWPNEPDVGENFRVLAIKIQRRQQRADRRRVSRVATRQFWGISAVRSPVQFGTRWESQTDDG